MKHPERVEDYLRHITEAIERATSYLQPLPDLQAFEKNRQVQDAVVRNIEIIGEAVSKINPLAPDFINQHAQLPWAQMRAMRNGCYSRIFFRRSEGRVDDHQNDLPWLKQQIDDLLGQERGGQAEKEPDLPQ